MAKTLSDYALMDILSSLTRGCLIATPGKKMPIADLSNIEGRGLVWLAQEQWKLDAFAEYDRMRLASGDWISGFDWAKRTRAGEIIELELDKKGEPIHGGHDLYALSYAKSFNVTAEAVMENKKTGDGSMRQIGKVQELACLGADTPVLTPSGLKPLIHITKEDLVWDGTQWVQHQGLVPRGVQRTMDLHGLQLTPDHQILAGGLWVAAVAVGSSANTLCRALETGSVNLPSWATGASTAEPAPSMSPMCSARAARRPTASTHTTCAKAAAPAATCAPKRPLGTGASSTTATPTCAPTRTTGGAFSIASLRASIGAATRRMRGIATTAAGASMSLLRGWLTGVSSCATWSPCLGGTTQTLSSTAPRWTGTTSLATCGSSPSKPTRPTDEKSGACSSESLTLRPVYDLLNAGPRNRFTVMTSRGPLVVHNCGYEGGVGAFVTFATGYGIDLDEMAGPVLESADPGLLNEARGMYAWLMDKKKGKNTYGLLPDTWVACDVIKRGWRAAHPQVSSWWKQLEQAFRDAIDNPGTAFQARTVTCHRPLLKSGKPSQWTTIVLPSGRRLCYPGARIEQDTGEVSYMGVNQFNRKWSRIKTYSGKLAENCIAEGTLVLTDHGALPIERVTTGMRVWDGVEFVNHQGLVPKGEQKVMECFGVWMTPDHEVLTAEGWKSAISTRGCFRAPCGLPDRHWAGGGVEQSPCRGPECRAQVYDLLNCGPLSRFVCLDADGRPLVVHNCTQAFARDVLAFNMPLIEERGYEIVLSVHDELLTETPDEPEYSSDRLAAWMANVPPWAKGLPLAAAGFETYRYRKD